MKKKENHTLESLTQLEKEIVLLIVKGSNEQEIAETLKINIDKAINYKNIIFKKLAIESDTELIFLAYSKPLY